MSDLDFDDDDETTSSDGQAEELEAILDSAETPAEKAIAEKIRGGKRMLRYTPTPPRVLHYRPN